MLKMDEDLERQGIEAFEKIEKWIIENGVYDRSRWQTDAGDLSFHDMKHSPVGPFKTIQEIKSRRGSVGSLFVYYRP